RQALSAAVAARTHGRHVVSCDLGGVDSTAICSLAARQEAKVVAYTGASPDPLADDVEWAARTVAGLGNVEHHIVPADEMPLVYHGLLRLDDQFDEPCAVTVDRDRWLIIAQGPPIDEPLVDWGFRPRLPPWTTPETVAAVKGLIRAEARNVQALAGGRGQHRELESMRFISRIARQVDQMAMRTGVMLAAPY